MVAGTVPALRGLGFNVDNFHGGPILVGAPDDPDAFCPPAAVGPRMIYALTSQSFGAVLDSCGDATILALVRHCSARCLDRAEGFRLIVTATPAEWAGLVERAPDLAGLPQIAVPPVPDALLPHAWLCQAPTIEDQTGAELSLLAILFALSARPAASRRDFARHDDMLAACDHPTVRHDQHRRRQITTGQLHRRLTRRHSDCAEWLPDADALAELFALEHALLGVHEGSLA